MKAYLASRFSRNDELLGYRTQLEDRGIEVTSRWLNGSHEWVQNGQEQTVPEYEAARFAEEDLDDIDEADVFVCFTEEPRSAASRGGRHVEFGWALATRKQIVIVGPRENVFYCLDDPTIVQTFSWDHALAYLEDLRDRFNEPYISTIYPDVPQFTHYIQKGED
jgi:nucleoside 2-deoxyribosyltransferase